MTAQRDSTEPLGVFLTTRQEQLIELLAAGHSNKQIATELGITEGTVKQHLFTLYRRLGVTNRARAVIAAQQIHKMTGSANRVRREKPEQSSTSVPRYAWRMISVVAVYLSDGEAAQPDLRIARDRYLGMMRDAVERCARSLDGQFASMPYGGFLVWFGHPHAHTDDADRAASLAVVAQHCSVHYRTQLGLDHEAASIMGRVGVAVATQAEIVAHNALELLGAEVFRRAAILARYASGLKVPIADEVTRRLAPLSVPWLAVRLREKPDHETLKRFGALFALGSRLTPLPDSRSTWGGLPFLDDVLVTVRSGVSQWLSVECWPAAVGVTLTDAIGNSAAAAQFDVLRLRLPASRGRLALAQNLIAQIECFAAGQPVSAPVNERAASPGYLMSLLADLSRTKVLAVLVYGPKGIDRLSDLLGSSGIQALVGSQILVVGSSVAAVEQPQTVLRLMGPRPGANLLSRVYALRVPEIDHLSERVRIGLQELLDTLSADARQLVTQAAADPNRSFFVIAKSIRLTENQAKECFNELAASGLVVPSGTAGRFQFRDHATAQAIARLNVALAPASQQG